MSYLLLILLIQIATIVHVVRSGANKLWILGVMIAPILGSIAYILLEVLPGMQGNRHLRYARQKAVEAIDPERAVRLARDQLEITDSLANRIALADALAESGRADEAVGQYEALLAGPHGRSEALLFKYASALFENGQAAAALETLDELTPATQISIEDRRALLRARALEHLDRDAEAAAIYADITTRLPGIEARARYAALLLKLGREDDARDALDEVVQRSRRLDRTQIGDDKPILDWAKATLSDLTRG